MMQQSSKSRGKTLPNGAAPSTDRRNRRARISSVSSSVKKHDVLISTRCDRHPMILRSCNKDLDNGKITGFEAKSRGDSNGMLLTYGANGRRKLLSMGWCLAQAPHIFPRDPTCRGNIINQHWIEKKMIRQWKRGCDSRNNKDCQTSPAACRLVPARPSWLIDTWRLCLIPGIIDVPYVALSYVWGEEPFFKTTKEQLPLLELDQAFFDCRSRLGVPRVIEDAIKLLDIMEERYLWVDALCIVQDDKESWHGQIQNMGSIFANATVTIMAKQGANSNFGLRGLKGISEPRNFVQSVFPLEKGYSIVKARQGPRHFTLWSQRGWIFQEDIFSRRHLIFSDDSVQWKCSCGFFQEDLTPPPASNLIGPSKSKAFSGPFPDLTIYSDLICEYNYRQFRYEEDALPAFSGTLSVLSHKFYGGFICGLPALFLDTGLIWQPQGSCERRIASKFSNPTKMSLPSWSWIGWKGEITISAWRYGNYCLSSDDYFRVQTIPLVQWYSRSWENMDLVAIKEPFDLQEMKHNGLNGIGNLPPGWRLHDYDAVKDGPEPTRRPYLYRHDSCPTTEFRYPIPLGVSPHNFPQSRSTDVLLCCRTQKMRAVLSQSPSRNWRLLFPGSSISIRNSQGEWIGELPLHNTKDWTENSFQYPPISCELVAISKGYANEMSKSLAYVIEEMLHKERPKGSEKYEYYNVLWVEWQDGIAYRKACGRVMKSAWESEELEWIDLVLG